jgi:hypothetical protein
MDILKDPRNEINMFLYKKIIAIIEYISKETLKKVFNIAEINENDEADEDNEENKYIYHRKKEDAKQGFQTICFDYLNLYKLFVCIEEEKKHFLIF